MRIPESHHPPPSKQTDTTTLYTSHQPEHDKTSRSLQVPPPPRQSPLPVSPQRLIPAVPNQSPPPSPPSPGPPANCRHDAPLGVHGLQTRVFPPGTSQEARWAHAPFARAVYPKHCLAARRCDAAVRLIAQLPVSGWKGRIWSWGWVVLTVAGEGDLRGVSIGGGGGGREVDMWS